MCCGGARKGLGHSTTHREMSRVREDVPRVRFTYTGRSSLTVIGSATRMQYRFDEPGASIAVDRRDAYGLAAVPALRRAIDG
jgi:hypothetical protein